MNKIAAGLIAGAAGTIALDMSTYADMAVRGRAASSVPSDVVRALAETVGATELAKPSPEASDATRNRRAGLGALSGYTVGLTVGAAAALFSPLLRKLPFTMRTLLIGGAAMAASDVPATLTGATNPGTWSTTSWMSDIVPHLLFGIITASVLESEIGR